MENDAMKTQEKNSGILLVAISAVSFGLIPIFAKMAYSSGTSIYTLLFLRFLVATAFMFSLMFIRKLPLPSRKEIISFLLLGAFGYAGQAFCYFMALNYASASVVALLIYTYPALVMIGSAIFLKERITTQKIVSLVLAFVGAFIIIGAEFEASPPGIILAISSAVFYSIYILINSRIIKAGMGIQSSAFTMLGVVFVYGIMNLFAGFTPPKETVGYIAILLIAMISTVLAFWSFLTGLEKTGASTTALVSTLEPVVIILSSVIFLSEKLTINIILGGILILTALIITTLSAKETA
jgi:drug/metabolite transporter (DMT)-like permease